jgi:hypothetical protein
MCKCVRLMTLLFARSENQKVGTQFHSLSTFLAALWGNPKPPMVRGKYPQLMRGYLANHL